MVEITLVGLAKGVEGLAEISPKIMEGCHVDVREDDEDTFGGVKT